MDNNEKALYGRRMTDVNIAEVVKLEVQRIFREIVTLPLVVPEGHVIATGDVVEANKQLPVRVVQKTGKVTFRRAKRTRRQMRDAVARAIPIVAMRHPEWNPWRVRRLAKNLVRNHKL